MVGRAAGPHRGHGCKIKWNLSLLRVFPAVKFCNPQRSCLGLPHLGVEASRAITRLVASKKLTTRYQSSQILP